ncbi:MAG: hypothetical protein KF838_12080 [Phycisphaeraceae bacterium]|nr:MAG: hypothetical protein KF838_12080 [Phycisphaeraceae bacterium]
MNASPTLDELCRVIEEVSGRRVFLDPTLVDTGARVDLPPRATVSEACDALVAALSVPSSRDRIHWTHSSAGIEVGDRRALFHCVAPRVYSLKPLLVEDGNGLTRDDLGRAGAVQPTLDELIRRAADEGWIDNGANIRAVGSLFVVNSTPAVHARVARFLMDYAAPERESVPPARPQPGSGG